jgi:hypothetical protein
VAGGEQLDDAVDADEAGAAGDEDGGQDDLRGARTLSARPWRSIVAGYTPRVTASPPVPAPLGARIGAWIVDRGWSVVAWCFVCLLTSGLGALGDQVPGVLALGVFAPAVVAGAMQTRWLARDRATIGMGQRGLVLVGVSGEPASAGVAVVRGVAGSAVRLSVVAAGLIALAGLGLMLPHFDDSVDEEHSGDQFQPTDFEGGLRQLERGLLLEVLALAVLAADAGRGLASDGRTLRDVLLETVIVERAGVSAATRLPGSTSTSRDPSGSRDASRGP